MKPIFIDLHWRQLLPLTFAKPVAHLLMGIDSVQSKWERHLGTDIDTLAAKHLQKAFPCSEASDNLVINSAALPSKALVTAIQDLAIGQVLISNGNIIAARLSEPDLRSIRAKFEQNENLAPVDYGKSVSFEGDCILIDRASDIFSQNDAVLRQDFEELTQGERTTDFPAHVIASGSDIFIHPEAKLDHCVLNASSGPIYIGANAHIMDGSLIRGPFALGANSTLKMGAKIYGPTSVGEHCKLGGEISNSIINSFSNKGHDGFLGNSVLGSWCNLGADTNTSNLKNNYSKIKVWDYPSGGYQQTNMQFHGLIMGDHAKAGINTMFNTGTVVGMCANVFDGGFPPKFVPSFSWGGKEGSVTFKLEKAFEAAAAMMERRNVDFTETDQEIFRFVSDHDKMYRS